MFRIGLTRWFVQSNLKHKDHGEISCFIKVVPQSHHYRILKKEWKGLHSFDQVSDVEIEEVQVESWCVKFCCSEYEYKEQIKCLPNYIRELVSNLVNYCLNKGLVDFKGFDKSACEWLVCQSIIKSLQSSHNEVPECIEFIDLEQEMREIKAEREREAERIRIQQEQQYAEDEARRFEAEKTKDKYTKTSFELLYSYLTENEKKQAEIDGKVTIKNLCGIFVVPVRNHGLIKHYNDEGKYQSSYCVVFQDYSIPIGDEILMKVALIKADSNKIFTIGVKMNERLGNL